MRPVYTAYTHNCVLRATHFQQRKAARQAEHLFQTLLHRAFQGEL